MPDPRNFAKIDLGYFDNPKITSLLDDHPRVPLLHLRAILYCRQHLTDGLFPIKPVVRMASANYCGSQCDPQCDPQCDFCIAVASGLFEPRSERNAFVHDYLEHQDSAKKAATRKAAGQTGAAARWGKSGDANRNTDSNANRIPNRNADRNAEKRREEKSNNTFDAFWNLYPRKVGKGAAVKAHKAAMRKATADEILEGLRSQLPRFASADPKFIPHAATWLNGERWADEFVDPKPVIDRRPEGWR